VALAFVFLAEPVRPGQVIGGLVIVVRRADHRGCLPFRIVRSATGRL